MTNSIDFAAIMPKVARALWGEPNPEFTRNGELRWGTYRSRRVDIEKGTFFDFEIKEGGGVLDLLEREGHNGLKWLEEHGFMNGAERKTQSSIVATYDYHDASGKLIYQVVRYEPKGFKQRRPDGNGGWEWKVSGFVDPVPYHLPELIDAAVQERPIYICEGEKDTDSARRYGLDATCNSGGANKWPAAFAKYFEKANVVIVPHNDEAGRSHVDQIVQSVHGTAARVRVLNPLGTHEGADLSDWLEAGGTIEAFNELVERAPDWKPAAEEKTNRFDWITGVNTSLMLTGNWLVKNILPRTGFGVMYGKTGSAKTFAALDISLSISRGENWRGQRVKQAAVSYIAMEAGKQAQNRIHAWMKHHAKAWPDRFRMSPKTLDLRSSQDDLLALIRDIRENQPDCGLVVIDTLSKALVGGNENGPEDMGLIVTHCERLAAELKCFVLLIHHSGKDEAKGSRGHTCLICAVDTEIEVRRAQREPGAITVSKQRDGETGIEFGFDLKVVELGHDEDHEIVTSCVVVPVDASEVKRSAEAKPKGHNELTLAKAFEQFVGDHGKPNPAGTGFPDAGKVQTVHFDEFRLFASGKFEGETKVKSRKARDAINSLIDRGVFVANEGRLWRVK